VSIFIALGPPFLYSPLDGVSVFLWADPGLDGYGRPLLFRSTSNEWCDET
jgi:hypothetical protein